MRSLTLSESVLGVHSPFPKPPSKPLCSSCYLQSFKFRSKKSCHQKIQNPSVVSPRYSSMWLANKYDEWLRRLTTDNLEGIELRRVIREPIDAIDDSVALDKAPVSIHLWKAILLSGLLTLQGSEPALALPDLASVLQSVPVLGDLGDISTGFASAFLLIFFSELGDKTFFIAALLAARNSAAVVFAGTFSALAAMTVISVGLGRTFHYVDEILPFRFGETDLPIDDIAAVLLLVYFGISTLRDAASSDGLKAEDEQREAEIAVSEFTGNGAGILAAASTVISTFALVFVAEWGDKSFFSTIALAAASSPLGVIAGALAGHGAATLLAVLGGSILGTFLSEKTIAYVGGVLFLVFAAVTVIEIVS
ncbi:protein PAM71, chloroplastic [Argentina anserina]|uniref:protein PAM71, chloroplastic n=1 Tax=Argentina anserina TaxID=57926 RepID=UPI0021765249|nr:protein PAM71, chloroplastic [Potentilla anserina]